MQTQDTASAKTTFAPTFKFSPLRSVDSTEANIFIHGYSAGHNLQDRLEMSRSIPPEMHDQLNIMAFWPSSHIMRFGGISKKVFTAAARLHFAVGAASVAADRAFHFYQIRSRANEMGGLLIEQLWDYMQQQYPKVTRINLIGHSLGARVVVKALTSEHWQRSNKHLQIGDVLLMAGAVEASASDLYVLLGRIEGALINAYSEEDKILLLNIDETCIGRAGLVPLANAPHVRNVHMQGFGHTDYWPNLREVMKQTAFAAWSPRTEPVLLAEQHFVKNDILLYEVLTRADTALLEAAIAHLETSMWAKVKAGESDRALTFTREFQEVAGHSLFNLLRGHGLSYVDALVMLIEPYGLTRELNECAKVVEYEAALLRCVFKHQFPEGHPLIHATPETIKAMPQSAYLEAINTLAERLTVASYFTPGSAKTQEESITVEHNKTKANSWFDEALSFVGGVKGQFERVFNNLTVAVKPGFSALIPAVAIVHYARLQVDEDDLM